jgi:hypothetical protein
MQRLQYNRLHARKVIRSKHEAVIKYSQIIIIKINKLYYIFLYIYFEENILKTKKKKTQKKTKKNLNNSVQSSLRLVVAAKCQLRASDLQVRVDLFTSSGITRNTIFKPRE